MSPFVETLGVMIVVCVGVGLGWWLARSGGGGGGGAGAGGTGERWYWLGVAISFSLVVYVAAAWWWGRSDLLPIPGMGQYFAGRNKLVIMGLAAPMLQIALLSRLRRKSEQRLVGAFLSIVMVRVVIFPFALAAVAAADLATLRTQIDTKGICLQSRDYTCGPAAAVTVLRRMGVRAEEGDLAVLARSNPLGGTDIEMLTSAINQRYGGQGVECECRHFKNLDELRAAGCSLGVIKYNEALDHCVAVLTIDAARVNTGDPLIGTHPYHRVDFDRVWRHVGIVFHRKV